MDASLRAQLVGELLSGRFASPAMISGASDGADTLFAKHALSAGETVWHVLGPRNTVSEEVQSSAPSTLLSVTDEVLEGEIVEPAFAAAATMRLLGPGCGTVDDFRTSRRNYLQVASASAVLAVAYRLPPSATTPTLDVGGGTGFAVQMYINRFEPLGKEPAADCQLFLFDDGAPEWAGCLKDPATHRKWNRWEPLTSTWTPCSSPPPRALVAGKPYAGIGGTRLSSFGEAALADLYATWYEEKQAPSS